MLFELLVLFCICSVFPKEVSSWQTWGLVVHFCPLLLSQGQRGQITETNRIIKLMGKPLRKPLH